MYTLLAAAAIAACMGGPGQPDCAHHRAYPGFAPNIHNGLLVTAPPEDETRVYTPGYSANRARLWVSDDVKDVRSRRAWRGNPGPVAYGAVAACDQERVQVRVYNQRVSVGAFQAVQGEGWSNLEAGRQQWLAERGYTGGVRTFIHPARIRAMQAEARQAQGEQACEDRATADGEGGTPQPSATIRLRKAREAGGVIKQVDAGVAGGVKLLAGDGPVRVSLPMTTKADVVQRAVARGWIESEETETQVTASKG